ncbi:MAG: sigma-70 family RNA polymerase sigma factor [Actinomycetota bacterium]|nr:sigma-70 family RNA polymerase sigma factor [Actinomycetota bacterium]
MPLGTSFPTVLESAQAGHDWAFTALYREYNSGLVRYFASRVFRDAEDLVAETWIGAARGLRAFAGDETQFRRWLYTIAHRRLADHRGEAERSRSDPVDPVTLDDVFLSGGPEELLLDCDSALATARRITAALSPDQAEVVLLRLYGQLSLGEVAEVMGRRVGAIRVLQHRALRRLQREFSVEGVTP